MPAEGETRPRFSLPLLAISSLHVLEHAVASEGGDRAAVRALGLLPSGEGNEAQVGLNAEAIADPMARMGVEHVAPPLAQAMASLAGFVVEGRLLLFFDPSKELLPTFERQLRALGAPPLPLRDCPVIDVYRAVAAKARAKPTIDRLLRENLGQGVSRGRVSVLELWEQGDYPGVATGLREDVVGLLRLLAIGSKRGTVSLDGVKIPVDWDRRLRLTRGSDPR